jgi:hypothetical protein
MTRHRRQGRAAARRLRPGGADSSEQHRKEWAAAEACGQRDLLDIGLTPDDPTRLRQEAIDEWRARDASEKRRLRQERRAARAAKSPKRRRRKLIGDEAPGPPPTAQ